MGNNLAPPFAIIFMHALECKLLETSPCKPLLYKRYIEDILILWVHGREKLGELVGHFSNGLTIETSEEKGHINYMDVTLHITTSGDISYQLFHKACNSGLLIDYHSAVPGHVKAAVATSQFRRAKQPSSHNIMRKESEAKVCQQLRLNHYPEVFINEAKTNANKARRQRCAHSFSAFLKLPFKSDSVHHKIRKLIRRHNFPVRIVYEHRGSLRNTLCRSALNVQVCRRLPVSGGTKKRGRPKGTCMACASGLAEGQCTTKIVVYKLTCKA